MQDAEDEGKSERKESVRAADNDTVDKLLC